MLLACPSPPAWAGAWVLPARRAWGQISVLHQDTTERYFLDGDRTPYFFDGRNRTTGAFLDLRYGVTDRLEVVAQLPVYRLRFDDLSDRRSSTGLGDLRLAARWNLRKGSTVATVGAALKFPTGEFVNDAEIVPVGEGQYDLDLSAEVGHSFWPRPIYLSVLAGYRLRGANRSNGISPGDEFFWSAEAGQSEKRRSGRHCPACLELLPSLGGRAVGKCLACGALPAAGRKCAKCQAESVWEAGANAGCNGCGHHGSKVKVFAGREWLKEG